MGCFEGMITVEHWGYKDNIGISTSLAAAKAALVHKVLLKTQLQPPDISGHDIGQETGQSRQSRSGAIHQRMTEHCVSTSLLAT